MYAECQAAPLKLSGTCGEISCRKKRGRSPVAAIAVRTFSVYVRYTSIPRNCLTSKPIPNETAATDKLIPAISPNRLPNGRSFATEM